MYKVYYLNQFRKSFATRDEATDYITRVIFGGGGRYDYGDFEILDGSDFL